jgi:hypothetical protein
VDHEFPGVRDVAWFEAAGSSTSLLAVLALMALAADGAATSDDLAAAAAAYAPWVGVVSITLDSFIDQDADGSSGEWSYIEYYANWQVDVERRAIELVARARAGLGALRHGERHQVILSMMLAMYLSSDNARAEPLASGARELLRAGGPTAVALAPVLRAWRLIYRLRA